MTSDDEPVAAPVPEPLQFEHADFTAAPAAPALACAACGQPIMDAYFEIQGKTLCGGCRDRVAAHFTGGPELPRLVRAVLLGSLAALGGMLLYYGVLVLTGRVFGILAIVVGYMVGAAVRKGARYRGGWVYQCLAVFLTYSAIVFSYVSVAVHEAVAGRLGRPAAGAEARADPARAAPPARAGAEPAPGAAQAPGAVAAALVSLIIQIYALPIVIGSHSLISLIILFFALLQAWRLNKRVPLVIRGPFQVGSGPSPQELAAHG
jgi:hypothetical protein